MALITLVLAILGVWSISAQVLHKSIVPKELKKGSEATVVCDSDLAGVPENGSPEGIYFLQLSWNKKFFYSFSRFGTGVTPGVKTHWRTRVFGHYPKNSRDLFNRDTFRLELDMINISFDDIGEFCCSSYISKNGNMQRPASKRCEDFIVTFHSILELGVNSQETQNLNIRHHQCTPDLAGIPYTATEFENLTLFWQNKDFDRSSYFLYTIRTYWYTSQEPDETLIKPGEKRHWTVLRFYQNVKPNKRMSVDLARLVLLIDGPQAQDAGWYCCSVTYFDKADAKRLSYRCQYLAVSSIRGIQYSTNGSSIKIVTVSLIFGLLIISWTLLHFNGVLHKSIVPKEVKLGSEVTVFCDSDLAGVPENDRSEGIFSLQLMWNKIFVYSFSTRFGTARTPGVKTHWRTRVSGHDPKNSRGFFYRDKFRVELDLINITPDDQGDFCCSSIISKNGKLQLPSTKRCEDFIVTNHSIVEPSVISQDPNLKIIQCTPDLAGIPDKATEMENVSLFWQNKDFYPNSYFLYTLKAYWYSGQYPEVNLIKPGGKVHWTVARKFENLKPNKRMVKDITWLGLLINGLQAQDAGWYCCSVTYYDIADAKRLAHRCHYLSVSGIQGIQYSTNGSSIKIVDESLIFGLLIFSWTLLHMFWGE
ncbi:uncharacterized protein LOC131937886 isoform X2 [Physella acuta]|uniref:uncharacterized protein LOC131937886 isoform X2 n=1 Tax=Physella acuta TaxID=109671 RepID=UPI0027DC34DD|nr:uncharacterized protein LOC131937886 isoform X2 [Physella acuta]